MTDTHIKINPVTPRVQYTGNGSTTSFPYSFAIFDDSDMVVYVGDDIITTGYTITGAGQTEGGAVVFDTAPADGVKITLLRNVPIERVTDFQEGGTFRPKNINDEFDRQTAFVQQVQETLSRAVVVPPTSDVSPDDVRVQVERVYESIDNVDSVADDLTNVDSVAGDLTNINAVAGNITNVNAVANNAANINAVNANKTNINAVNANKTNINTVASISSNVNTVAGISSKVSSVAAISSDVTTVADNIQAITDAPTYAQEAKDWANKTSATVDGSEYSAKHYAEEAASILINKVDNHYSIEDIYTNCITEIPQDIKLELASDGTLTLKAGSVVTKPDGTQITTTQDYTKTHTSNGKFYVFGSIASGSIAGPIPVSKVGSGPTLPEDNSTYTRFFNTTDKKIYVWTDGEWVVWNVFLPYGIITVSEGQISSIDNVFNGCGYIGHTVFVLPGITGLAPNGRNQDGSYNTINITEPELRFYTISTNDYTNIVMVVASGGGIGAGKYSRQETLASTGRTYVPSKNKVYISDGTEQASFPILSYDNEGETITRFEIFPVSGKYSLSDVINVKDFGAKGDGVTDDSSAIQAAFTKAYQNSGSVYFPEGLYVISSSIPYFSSVLSTGSGRIKDGGNEFYITNFGSHTNKLYVSTTGTGDGLSSTRPTSFENVIQYLQNLGTLNGNWIVNVAAGEYTNQPDFTGITVVNYNGLTIKGAGHSGTINNTTKEDNRTWETILKFPVGATHNWALRLQKINGATVEDIAFDAENGIFPNTDESCVQFQKCGTVYFTNCKISNIREFGIDNHSTESVIIGGSTFVGRAGSNNSSGVYTKRGGITTLTTLNSTSRNRFVGLTIGIKAIGQSYVHCDYNDFKNCATAVYANMSSYIGVNNCYQEGCTKLREAYAGSRINIKGDDFTSSSNKASIYRFYNLTKENIPYEGWKQGFYYPARGTNGAWGFGFNNDANLPCAATFNVTAEDLENNINAGDAPARINNVNPRGICVCSKNTHAYLTMLSNNNSFVSGIIFIDDGNAYNNMSIERTKDRIEIKDSSTVICDFKSGATRTRDVNPFATNTYNLGSSSALWKEIFCANATINTSDERQKQEIEDVDERVFKAWGKVKFRQFLFNDAVEKKGKENARIHVGLIAQQVKEAFESEGLDGFKYGLLCYDEWQAEAEERDAAGNIVNPGHEAGNAYGIRYGEALALECAYQRWITNKLEERIKALEDK